MNKLRAQVIALPSQRRKFWPVAFALVLLLALIAGAGAGIAGANGQVEKRAYCHANSGARGFTYHFNSAWVAHFENNGTPKAGHEIDFFTFEGDTACVGGDPPTPTPTDEPPTPTPTDAPPTPTDVPPTPTDVPPCEECDPTPTPTDTPPVPTPTNVLPECNLIPQYEQWRLEDSNQKEGYVAACYIISVKPPSVERQAQLCTACGDQLDQSENAYTFRADSWIHGTVYLNECTGEYVFIEDGGKVITEWQSEWFRSGFNDNIRTSPRCPTCEAKATAQANGQ